MRGGITGAKTLTHTHTHQNPPCRYQNPLRKPGTVRITLHHSGNTLGGLGQDWDRTDQNRIDQDRLRHTEMDRARPGQTCTDFKGQTGMDRMDWVDWADRDGLGRTGTEKEDGTFRDVGKGFVPYGEQRQQVEEECDEGSDQQAASADRHRERAAEDTNSSHDKLVIRVLFVCVCGGGSKITEDLKKLKDCECK